MSASPQALAGLGLVLLLGANLVYSVYCYFVKRKDVIYEKAGKRWLAPESVSITVSIFIVTQLLGAALLALLVKAITHWSTDQLLAWTTKSVWGQFGFVLFAELLTLFLLYVFLKRRHANRRDLGLNRPAAKHIAYALAGFVVYFLLYIVILIIAKQLFHGLNIDQKQELGFDMKAHGATLVPIFISLVILPPITEEIVVRGFLFGGLRTKLPFIVSAAIASTVFAAAHLGEGGSGGLLWVAGIDTFVLSMVLCYLREKTGSLWPSIGVHMIKNGLAFILLFDIVKYFR